jgi:tetratricopeptide (TPR) repeat protein
MQRNQFHDLFRSPRFYETIPDSPFEGGEGDVAVPVRAVFSKNGQCPDNHGARASLARWNFIKLCFFQLAILILTAGNLFPVQDCARLAATKPGDHLLLGKCFAAKNEWKEAEEQFRAYRLAYPKSDLATVSHAKALVQIDQPFEAVLELKDFLGSVPDSVPALKLYAALLYTVVQDKLRAEDAWQKCSKLAPGDIEVWKSLGDLYLNQKKIPEAIHSYEEASRLSPSDALLMAGLASSYGRAGLLPQAESKFARAIQLNQQVAKPNPRVYILYAEYLLNQNRAAESVPVFTKALLVDPHSSDAYYGRATAYEKTKDPRHAEADALAAIRESDKRKDAHLLLLRLYRAQNRQEKVQEHIALVEKLEEQENTELAFDRKTRQALRLWFEKVEPLLQEQKCTETIRHCVDIVELWPSFPEPYFALGACYSQTGQPAQAQSSFKQYLSLKPGSADGHAAFGVFLLQQGRNQDAARELERALSTDPGLLEARKALASIHLSTGDSRSAIRVLQSTDESSELDNEARLMLAQALMLSREYATALSQVDRVLSSEPTNSAATKLKQLILSQSK